MGIGDSDPGWPWTLTAVLNASLVPLFMNVSCLRETGRGIASSLGNCPPRYQGLHQPRTQGWRGGVIVVIQEFQRLSPSDYWMSGILVEFGL